MIGMVITEMIKYYAGDVKRINHFLKVYSLAKAIGEEEKLSIDEQQTLEIVAVLHDIGIKISEEKHQSSEGKYQEIEGPPVARQMLEKLNYTGNDIEDICFIIGHHHTYNSINTKTHQILVEADFLVNIFEENIPKKQIVIVKERIFKTLTGIKYFESLYER